MSLYEDINLEHRPELYGFLSLWLMVFHLEMFFKPLLGSVYLDRIASLGDCCVDVFLIIAIPFFLWQDHLSWNFLYDISGASFLIKRKTIIPRRIEFPETVFSHFDSSHPLPFQLRYFLHAQPLQIQPPFLRQCFIGDLSHSSLPFVCDLLLRIKRISLSNRITCIYSSGILYQTTCPKCTTPGSSSRIMNSASCSG